MGNLTNPFLAGLVFLVCGGGLSVIYALRKAKADERVNRENRKRFWDAIPAMARTLAATDPGIRLTPGSWERSLMDFYRAEFSLEETLAILRQFGAAPGPEWHDFMSFLARKNAWSLATFGPGDRFTGIVDHIRKELIELEKSPKDLAEWIDLIFLATDGAFRCAGADPAAIMKALEDKLAVNQARKWPDWRTVEIGKAIEHVRS